MQLFINTSTNDEVIIALMEGGSVVLEKRFSARYRQAELLLVEIDSLLAEKKVKLEKIDKIHSLQINISTTAKTREEAKELFYLLGFIFVK